MDASVRLYPTIMLTERDKTAHLLRRFGLGASEAEIDFYGKDGHQAAIDKLLNYENVPEVMTWTPLDIASKGQPKMKEAQLWWFLKLATTRRPLQEKMTIFWHNHFATASMKVDVAMAMVNQNQLLRDNALGGFRELLLAVSKDPAMLYWLDNQFNVKGKPNENFAREVMELFTLGIGHYTEKDVQEGARAFTGWTYGVGRRQTDKPRPNSSFKFVPELHDAGMKNYLGNRGTFNGDDVCGILAGNPQTAVFIVTKMWKWFAYLDPEPAVIDRLATNFRKSGLEIKSLVRDIMQAPEFYSDKCVHRAYKNPVDFCVATVRQLGLGSMVLDAVSKLPEDKKIARIGPMNPMYVSTKAMGMELLNPPDVSGWKYGPEWISSATIVERIKWADFLFGKSRYQAIRLFGENATAMDVAQKMTSIFDVQFSSEKIRQLALAAETVSEGEITSRNANKVANAVARLIFGSPEFQFC